MLTGEQRAILSAYGKANMTLKSHAILHDGDDFLVIPCDELLARKKNKELVRWMHPRTIPDWDEFGITDADFESYLKMRFPLLLKYIDSMS